MKALYLLLIQIIHMYWWIVIINVILSWLILFNVLNTQNKFVYSIIDFTNRLTDPILNKIRRYIPNLGSIDISPLILLLFLWFLKLCMHLYLRPILFN